MSDAPGAADVLDAAARCRWPSLTICGIALNGEPDWRRLVAMMVPRERSAVLRRLGRYSLLVCSAAGRAHLRAWLDAGAPPPAWPPRVYGDIEAVPLIHAACATLPAPVRHRVVETTSFDACGFSSRAWIAPPEPGAVRRARHALVGPEHGAP
jgi:hypothetical protein